MAANPTPAQIVMSLFALGLVSAVMAAWAWAVMRFASGRGLLPDRPTGAVPWRSRHVLGVLLLYVGVGVMVPDLTLALAGVAAARGPDGTVDAGLRNLAMLASNGAFLLLTPILLARWSRARASDFGLGRGRIGWNIVRGLVAWPILAPIVFGVNLLAVTVWKRDRHPIEDWIAGGVSPLDWALAGLSAVVLAPMAEEFLFRGVLLGWLDRWAMGSSPKPPIVDEFGNPIESTASEPAAPDGRGWRFLAANAGVSLVFAALHWQVWPTPVPLFFLSLGLGVLYQRTGGLVAPVALHAAFNGISTLLLYLSVLSGGPDALKPDRPPVPPPDAAEKPHHVDAARRPRVARIET